MSSRSDGIRTHIGPPARRGEKIQFLFVLRRPGIEPGPHAWKARILTIELSTLRTMLSRSGGIRTHIRWAVPPPLVDGGIRTRDGIRTRGGTTSRLHGVYTKWCIGKNSTDGHVRAVVAKPEENAYSATSKFQYDPGSPG